MKNTQNPECGPPRGVHTDQSDPPQQRSEQRDAPRAHYRRQHGVDLHNYARHLRGDVQSTTFEIASQAREEEGRGYETAAQRTCVEICEALRDGVLDLHTRRALAEVYPAIFGGHS